MSKEQIEEMSTEIREAVNGCSSYWSGVIAEHLYNEGYRKQSEPISCGHEKGREWISVDERLPDGNGRFLTVDKKGDMMVCYWEKRFGWFASVCNKNAITHWMPLPEPPDMKGGAE